MSGTLRLTGSTSGYIEIQAPAEANGATHVIPNTGFAAGKILQVKSTTKDDVVSTTSTTFAAIPGLTVDITPTAATSKIFVSYTLRSGNQGTLARFKLWRGSTQIYMGASVSAKTQEASAYYGQTGSEGYYGMNDLAGQYLDDPGTTSELTYSFTWATSHANYYNYLNRSYNDGATYYNARGASTITVMEIGA